MLFDIVSVSSSEFRLCKKNPKDGVTCFICTMRTARLESRTCDFICIRKVLIVLNSLEKSSPSGQRMFSLNYSTSSRYLSLTYHMFFVVIFSDAEISMNFDVSIPYVLFSMFLNITKTKVDNTKEDINTLYCNKTNNIVVLFGQCLN